MTENFQSWIESHEGKEWRWYVKRLSANDTLATGSHQAGPYIPNNYAFQLFPSLATSNDPNPKVSLRGSVDSHKTPERELAITWYRQAKNECRITRWGGMNSAVLDPDSTGSIAVFAFEGPVASDSSYVAAWVCTIEDENLLIEHIGPVEPGISKLITGPNSLGTASAPTGSCWFTEKTIPIDWLTKFPSGEKIVEKCVELRSLLGETPDKRLIQRRNCEFEMFRSIEELHVLPRVKLGFSNVDDFIEYSNSVNNRRKSRSGRSLELQVREILKEEGVPFSHGQVSEGNKKPDFLFPSSDAYARSEHPLWMLAAKTTCKDRWRQILNEADLIPNKHLLTLQEGVSKNQHEEMRAAGVTLVVPEPLFINYPKEIRPSLMKFGAFIEMVRNA